MQRNIKHKVLVAVTPGASSDGRPGREDSPLRQKLPRKCISKMLYAALAGCCLLGKVLRCKSTVRRRFDLIKCLFLFVKSAGLMLSWSGLAQLHWTTAASFWKLSMPSILLCFCKTALYIIFFLCYSSFYLTVLAILFVSEEAAVSLLSVMGKWGWPSQRWQFLRLKYSYLSLLWFFQSPWTEITVALTEKGGCSNPYMLVPVTLWRGWEDFRLVRYTASPELKGKGPGTSSLMSITFSIVSSMLQLLKASGIGIALGNCCLPLCYRLYLLADRNMGN